MTSNSLYIRRNSFCYPETVYVRNSYCTCPNSRILIFFTKTVITFEQNKVVREENLQAERADFDGSIELSFAPIARSKPLQKIADINFILIF